MIKVKKNPISRATTFVSMQRGSGATKCKNALAGPSRHAVRNGVSAPSLTPANPTPARRRRRARRIFSKGFYLPRGKQSLVLHLPKIRRAMDFHRRELISRAAVQLIASGMNLNCCARCFGVGASTLCVWLQRLQIGGIEALRPADGRNSKSTSTACRLSLYVGG